MGLGMFSGSRDWFDEESKIKKGNPDPKDFEFIRLEQMELMVIAEIKYPNCTNYKGHKILVFAGTTMKRIKKRKKIDPHFLEDYGESPIARFKPTAHGWQMAKLFCHNYNLNMRRK